MILFLDTETTGLVNTKLPEDDPAQPRLVQLAAILQERDGTDVAEMSVIITPDNWDMHPKAEAAHGISVAYAETVGVPLRSALSLFSQMARRAYLLVAHNMAFDIAVVRAELARNGWPDVVEKIPRFCTMLASTDLLKLPGNFGYKWPKLEELHQHFFGTGVENAHDALADVRACARCYRELVRSEAIAA